MVGPGGDTEMLSCPTLSTVGLSSFYQAQTGEWLGKSLHLPWGQAGPFHWSTVGASWEWRLERKQSTWQQGVQVMLSFIPHCLADCQGPSGTALYHSSHQTAMLSQGSWGRQLAMLCLSTTLPAKLVKASSPSGLPFSLSQTEITSLDSECPLTGSVSHKCAAQSAQIFFRISMYRYKSRNAMCAWHNL